MSRPMLNVVGAMVIGLATAAVGFAQRQPAGAGTAERNRAGSDRAASDGAGSSSNGASGNRAATAADRTRAGDAHSKSAKATFEVYKDKGGEYRWRLRATNTQIIAMAAQSYSDKRACLNAIESVRRDVPDAPVEEKEAVAKDSDDHAKAHGAATAGSSSGATNKNKQDK